MKDFTKEELESIHLDMTYNILKEKNVAPSYIELHNKIERMIENYCEHECNGEVEIFVDTCKKCNAYLLREKYHE